MARYIEKPSKSVFVAPSADRPVSVAIKHSTDSTHTPFHHHPYAQLAFTDSGIVKVVTTHHTYVVPAQHAVWIAPGTPHAAYLLKGAQIYNVAMHPSYSIKHADCDCHCLRVSDLAKAIVKTLIHEPKGPQPSPREQALWSLLIGEVKSAGPLPLGLPMPKEKRLKHLCELFIAQPNQSLTLSALCRQVGASESTMTRLFKRELTMTFNQWRNQALLTFAAALFAQDYDFGYIAQELGYGSQSAFTAMVTNLVGIPPSVFFSASAESAFTPRASFTR